MSRVVFTIYRLRKRSSYAVWERHVPFSVQCTPTIENKMNKFIHKIAAFYYMENLFISFVVHMTLYLMHSRSIACTATFATQLCLPPHFIVPFHIKYSMRFEMNVSVIVVKFGFSYFGLFFRIRPRKTLNLFGLQA